jgi:hypothetical protein
MALIGSVLGLLAGIAPAWAADCDPVFDLALDTTRPVSQAVRPGLDRVHFSKAAPNCPAATPACTAAAYLVPGNIVLVTGAAGDWACAAFLGGPPRYRLTTGWLPRSALTDPAGPPPSAADWSGTWTAKTLGNDQTLTLHATASGTIAIQGETVWGGDDPQRVANGSIHMGDVGAEAKPSGDRLSAAEDGSDCKLRLWLVGAMLAAGDNQACGGLNATFTGFYHRRAGRPAR